MMAYLEYESNSKMKDIKEYVNTLSDLYPKFPLYNTYQFLLIDPPWTFDRIMLGRNPPYPCLNLAQLKLLPLKEIADPEGSIILMWTTGSHMK